MLYWLLYDHWLNSQSLNNHDIIIVNYERAVYCAVKRKEAVLLIIMIFCLERDDI